MRKDKLEPYEIRWLRRAMGFTQAEFGNFFGRDAAAIFRWENGQYRADPASTATLLLLWNDVHQQLGQTGLDSGQLRPPRNLPDGWKEFVGTLVVGGVFFYLLSKLDSE